MKELAAKLNPHVLPQHHDTRRLSELLSEHQTILSLDNDKISEAMQDSVKIICDLEDKESGAPPQMSVLQENSPSDVLENDTTDPPENLNCYNNDLMQQVACHNSVKLVEGSNVNVGVKSIEIRQTNVASPEQNEHAPVNTDVAPIAANKKPICCTRQSSRVYDKEVPI